MDNIRKILEAVAKEHPYKIPSWRETYDKYNEGWTNAVNRIESMLPEQTETQCYLGSPCEYQNPDVEIAQLSQEGTTSDLIDRQAAIDAADKIIERDTSGSNAVVNAMIAWSEYIKQLPSAQPEHHTWFQIGEVLVDESKGHITAEQAIKKIRECMRVAKMETNT